MGNYKKLGRMSLLPHSACPDIAWTLACRVNPGISLTLRYRMAEAANLGHGSNLRESLAKYLHFPDKMTSL